MDEMVTRGMDAQDQVVVSYLRHLASATKVLASDDASFKDLVTLPQHENLNSTVEAIARDLLQAFTPENLLLETEGLPRIGAATDDEELMKPNDDEEEDDEDAARKHSFDYQYRRTDYLRRLLRFMAPISMHVASQVCKKILNDGDKTSSTTKVTQAAFLLFSHWLPVAPHLTSMATELFESLKDPWQTLDLHHQAHVFLFVEASYKLCSFYLKRRQISTLQRIWDWTFLFGVLQASDVEMDQRLASTVREFVPQALQWYASRALTAVLNWKPQVVASVLDQWQLSAENVPWEPHPWMINDEEKEIEVASFRRVYRLFAAEALTLPSALQIATSLPASPYLAHVGNGIFFYKVKTLTHPLVEYKENSQKESTSLVMGDSLIPTATTCKNLALLGAGLCEEPHPPPIMLCGPHGSGKSSLLREMLRLCRPGDSLLEFHIDEETDSKTLIGSYSTTDIPGEFSWRPGALTQASREGRWILFEDIDTVPIEIQATIVKLLEDRMLPLGNGKYEMCHPDFRMFATCTTTRSANENKSNLRFGAKRGGGRQILNPSLWRKIHIQPLPFHELNDVATALYPHIPTSVIEVALSIMKFLDMSGREEITSNESPDQQNSTTGSLMDFRTLSLYTGGRSPSVRDLFKLFSRISHSVAFEKGTMYTTEAQRMVCLAESVEILVGSCPDMERKEHFVAQLAAPAWGISGEQARAYVTGRRPECKYGADFVCLGRAELHIGRKSEFSRKRSETFADTNHALRFMESIGVCVRQNEPILLVGETGCGKTSMIQQLAGLCERELVVQNLSLQTDSTDLLGGFKPLELNNIARKVYMDFVDLFTSTFSRKQNAKFLQFASSMLEKESWKKLSQCFQRAAKLGISKMEERLQAKEGSLRNNQSLALNWDRFKEAATKFDRQILSSDAKLAFVFAEGALVDAIKNGKWVLLDEINLASSDTLQRLCGLLDDPSGSITLTERGDASEIPRHPNFRLFAAMNPATDAGKKDLPASIRSRFSELYVHELLDPVELRSVAARYLQGVLPVDGKPPEHKDVVINVIEVYIQCRNLAETVLSDGSGHKPRYTLRTLSRALTAARTLLLEQRLPLYRALYEGFQLAFEGALSSASVKDMKRLLKSLLPETVKKADLEHPGRRPKVEEGTNYELVKPFWIKDGPHPKDDWSRASSDGKTRFILTPSISTSLRRLSRALASGPWPILLEGPTSAGKTTLVEYIAARCGHHVVRINNHEHTDVQEYTGSFVADRDGRLVFCDGLLVRALRLGHWVILDELNLAPSEVLEALNRLLDDNRELYLAETNETVKPHPDFRLFATQNPSGAYGGRKPLSRAFRNRFVELHMGDIPSDEMTTILEQRCGCPPSTAKRLVEVMVALRYQRSKGSLFLGKDSFITPRDLLRWAERKSESRLEFAQQGYMLLAERLRSENEKEMVQGVIEECLKVKLDPSEMYYGENTIARNVLDGLMQDDELLSSPFAASIAPTNSLLRLISLVMTCIEQKEPVLLVGDTGSGKTTVVQFLSLLYKKTLHIVNCHATTETSDLLGGLRPIRGRDAIRQKIHSHLQSLLSGWPYPALLKEIDEPVVTEYLERAPVSSLSPKVETMAAVAKAVLHARPDPSHLGGMSMDGKRTSKRRKLSESCSSNTDEDDSRSGDDEQIEPLRAIAEEIEQLALRYDSLFEWSDGPLVTSMKAGDMILLDEMSLAEDAVLERLNSVLEPSRTLVLAEKGDDGAKEESRVIKAHEDFRIFATMNPGGDFGKRELSPALRSRFTEIWVPAVTEESDFRLVLERVMGTVFVQSSSLVIDRMLEYVKWFNGKICGDSSSPCAGCSLSLRDVLSWAHFIIEICGSGHSVGVWDAYKHGAALMHLDGLGLGAGLAVEEADKVRAQAESFLQAQVSGNPSHFISFVGDGFFIKDGALFGAGSFYVPVGPLEIPNKSSFNMAAPTTANNVFRVLRGLQLRKPILLEGPPGVGKTSLITALAVASGNKLVRINLSEQTDISDLMGSDLPTQNNSASGGAAFEWFDGVLLGAIKDGSWVLLDELNLASQSVLEGLNSCLDHRANVYIPELGQSFNCPSTFRIFGAQNPLGQGGGRKGLPKSFLNRFTKVYVDELSDADLRTIVRSKYETFDEKKVNSMVSFNKTIHSLVTQKREFGSEGAPWEFNLRDVFRWCELIERQGLPIHSCARDLYLQRFRNEDDRKRVDLLFQNYFQDTMQPEIPPAFHIFDNKIQIGDTTLRRINALESSIGNPLMPYPQLLLSRLSLMEALARCVAMKWPSLIIGPPSSGKTTTVLGLAESCNTKVVELCLSPSSDVSELLGCFEQVDNHDFEFSIALRLRKAIDLFLSVDAIRNQICRQLWNATTRLERYVMNTNEFADRSSFLHFAKDLCARLQCEIKYLASPSARLVDSLEGLRINIDQGIESTGPGDTGHFVWRDGVLVQAMSKGFWLVLSNVNLCPSSVLDRLNSVMEINGELLLSECGSKDGDGKFSHRIIRAHPNFRIFLTMDSSNGEVSRAMRNRCVELYFQRPLQLGPSGEDGKGSLCPEQRVDLLASLHINGVRTLDLASTIVTALLREEGNSLVLGEETCCARVIVASTRMLSTLLKRGVSSGSGTLDLLRVAFELDEINARNRAQDVNFGIVCQTSNSPLIYGAPLRHVWLQKPEEAKVEWDARVLLPFSEPTLDAVSHNNNSLLLFDQRCGSDELLEELCIGQPANPRDLVPKIARIFLSSFTGRDTDIRFTYFDMYHSNFQPSVRWMAQQLERKLSVFQESRLFTQASGQSSEADTAIPSVTNEYLTFKNLRLASFRLDREYLERRWLGSVSTQSGSLDFSDQMTVLEVSYLSSTGMLDRSVLSCPTTPLLYPLIAAIDTIVQQLTVASTSLDSIDSEGLCHVVTSTLRERDRMWDLLTATPVFTRNSSAFLGFDATEFLVQWKWLKKALEEMYLKLTEDFNTRLVSLHEQLSSLVSLIDTNIFDRAENSWCLRKVSKVFRRPRVPREVSQWEGVFDLRNLALSCSLITGQRFEPFGGPLKPVELSSLIEEEHPLLFIDDDFRRQVLAALATVHFQCTDATRRDKINPRSETFLLLELGKRLQIMIDTSRQTFQSKLQRAKVDANISTIENQLSVEKLEEMHESSASTVTGFEAYSNLTQSLLASFARVQLSPFEEYEVVRKERNVMAQILTAIGSCNGNLVISTELKRLLAAVKDFILDFFACVIWPVSDIRPYQTFVWVLEGSNMTGEEKADFSMSLLPSMLASLDRHSWSNSFNESARITPKLEIPSMWIDDEAPTTVTSLRANSVHPRFGHARIIQRVRTEMLLRSVGEQFVLKDRAKKPRFHTIENYEHRAKQYERVNKLLSLNQTDSHKVDFSKLLFLTREFCMVLREGLKCDEFDPIIELLRGPDQLRQQSIESLDNFLNFFDGGIVALAELLEPVFRPLLKCLLVSAKAKESSDTYWENISLSEVYLGLLQLHFSSPQSPLDPGRAPVAKVSLVNRRLVVLRNEVTAQRLFNGFANGNFTFCTPEIMDTLQEVGLLLSKRAYQADKIVERPKGAVAFHELFRVIRDFAEKRSSPSSILDLVREILNKGDAAKSRNRTFNWLQTSASFCHRLDSDFVGYEDFTTLTRNSIRMMQDGLVGLLDIVETRDLYDNEELNLFDRFLQYPMNDVVGTISLAASTLGSSKNSNGRKSDIVELNFALASAALSRLLLRKRVLGNRKEDLQLYFDLFDKIAISGEGRTDEENAGRTLDDIQEQKYLEQFPDHSREFVLLFETKDDDASDDEGNIEQQEETENHMSPFDFTDKQLEMLYFLFKEFFQDTASIQDDSTRALAFHHGYNAARAMEVVNSCSTRSQRLSERLACHSFALMLSSLPSSSHSRIFPYLYDRSQKLDFHNESNPFEVQRSKKSLERLMARCTQLLSAFPGHSILLGIGRVCDKVCKFDIATTPIGKVMTGMEIILRQAQDWEQHASDRVRLGEPLKEVGRLVTSWRKLELESWQELIHSRKARHQRKARKHMIRLHSILRDQGKKDGFENFLGLIDSACRVIPQWVWKGSVSSGQVVSSEFNVDGGDDLIALTKVLDTFVLTSPLGEFQERLEILRCFATQHEATFEHISKGCAWTLRKIRLLLSIHDYYYQFTDPLVSKLNSAVDGIQSKLKDEVKLAKWDEQTYYAMVESTEKNHRKLMKILSELDETLDLNVGQLIQEERINGVRSNVDTQDGVSATIPSDSTIFPYLDTSFVGVSHGISTQRDSISKLVGREWTVIDTLETRVNHLKCIPKYAKKMAKLLHAREKSHDSKPWAQIGTYGAFDLYTSIFNRLASLRNKSVKNRPMKERALVDLFRELKKNGFSTTKWAVPNQIRRIEELFQLPSPDADDIAYDESSKARVARGEKYYQRCVVELNEYRSESLHLGSKYMTKRQSDIMLALGESGMLMIAQQRSLLASAAGDCVRLGNLVKVLQFEDNVLPCDQASVIISLQELEETLAIAVDCLRQLALFIKSSSPLLNEDRASEWARDAVSKIDHCLDKLSSCGNALLLPYEMLKTSHLQQINEKCHVIVACRSVLIDCKQECSKLECLPVDCFDAPLQELDKVLMTAEKITKLRSVSRRDQATVENFATSLSEGIERSLIAFQNLVKDTQRNELDEEKMEPLWKCQGEMIKVWASSNIHDLSKSTERMLLVLAQLHNVEDESIVGNREKLVGLASDYGVVLGHVHAESQRALSAMASFYTESSKLVYILLRIFRVLLSKGFCSDQTAEDEGSDTGGDVEGMTFEDDLEGTGMGEGDGKRDVTDQLESEDQLAGLKNDKEDGDKDENRDPRQLNEEEANQGMEMEGDFDGEMFDVPDQPKDDQADDDEGEELEREMGEEASPDEQVVDERMWNDSDDEDDIKGEEEKFEKDSGVEGEAIDGAMRTKEDDEDNAASDPKEKEEHHQNSRDESQEESQEGGGGDDDKNDINEDMDDRYEDQHHVDVRGEEKDNEDGSGPEEQMQLDDDLNLDDGEEDGPESTEAEAEVDTSDQPDENDPENEALPMDENAQQENDEKNDEIDEINAQGGTAERNPEEKEEKTDMETEEDQNEEEATSNIQNQQQSEQEAHGVRSSDGIDNLIGDEEEKDKGSDENEGGGDNTGSQGAAQAQADSSGGRGLSEHDGIVDEADATQQDNNMDNIPNPFKNAGDASKFWHKKLNIVDEGDQDEEETNEAQGEEPPSEINEQGDFQYSAKDEQNPTQVLGEAAEEEAVELNQPDSEKSEAKDTSKNEDETERRPTEPERAVEKKQKKRSGAIKNEQEAPDDQSFSEEDKSSIQDEKMDVSEDEMDPEHETALDDDLIGNRIVSDLSRLKVEGQDARMEIQGQMVEDEQVTGISSSEAAEARAEWLQIQGETHSVARRLCEKLRLVMEPLVASKLRGDYRTGKRINMKRVIGYIASGYRKDKIWLRRTKAAKRDYRVLLAVDNSESMKKSGAGNMALRALATLAVGMNQLEIGELGIASFGEDMKLLHPFGLPFGTESGADMVLNFKFDQKRTRTSLCVESAIAALDSMGGHSSMQLVFMVSDGRIERDSRDKLKRLIREMMERNILLAMIIVEGEHKKKDSIVNMKEVTFQKGKPVVKRFIEDYPFPYYIVLDDMTMLPEVLGDALRQWFEMLTQLQSIR